VGRLWETLGPAGAPLLLKGIPAPPGRSVCEWAFGGTPWARPARPFYNRKYRLASPESVKCRPNVSHRRPTRWTAEQL